MIGQAGWLCVYVGCLWGQHCCLCLPGMAGMVRWAAVQHLVPNHSVPRLPCHPNSPIVFLPCPRLRCNISACGLCCIVAFWCPVRLGLVESPLRPAHAQDRLGPCSVQRHWPLCRCLQHASPSRQLRAWA